MKRLTECISIAEFLTHELSRRKHKNRSYSLRAFARDLGISPSRLSEVLNGGGLSEKNASQIAERLELKSRETEYLKDLVLATMARNTKVRELAQFRIGEIRKAETVRRLKEDQFRVISDWYHGAILEVTQLIDFQPDMKWIAGRLGITTPQVEGAVERLEELGLLKRGKEGIWNVNPQAYSAFSETPSSAIRKFHRQILSMAIDSVIEDSMEDRELTAMIVALPKTRMHEFRREMQKFMNSFWEKIENDPKDDLYALSVQLCPVRNRRRG